MDTSSKENPFSKVSPLAYYLDYKVFITHLRALQLKKATGKVHFNMDMSTQYSKFLGSISPKLVNIV